MIILVTPLLILAYLVYIIFLIHAWASIYDLSYFYFSNQGLIQYQPNKFISEKLLILLTVGVFFLPPFVVTYVVAKRTLNVLYKIYKYMKRVFTSDHKWFV
jgi:hypothetical protein